MDTILRSPGSKVSKSRLLIGILALAFLIPGAFSVSIAYASPGPFIRIRPLDDSIEGWEWVEGSSVTITIDDPDDEICEGYSETKTVGLHHEEPRTYVLFELWGICDLSAGHVITMSDGSATRVLEIADVVVTAIDADNETITGTAPPDATIQLHPHECSGECDVIATADSSGNWTASYEGKQDLVPGMGGAAQHEDIDGDVTWIDWQVPFTRMTVNFSHDWIEGRDWPVGVEVTLTIDDPGSDEDYSDTQVAAGNPNNPLIGMVWFGFWETYDVQPGYIATMAGGGTEISHTVYDLAMTSFDLSLNTLGGTTSTPDGELWVTVYDDCWETVGVTSVGGEWFASFNGLCTIAPGTDGDLERADSEGNVTLAMWRVPNPTLSAWPLDDRVEGWEWEVNSEVTLTIDDPAVGGPIDFTATGWVGVAEWNPDESYIMFEFGDHPFDLQPDHVVTLTDGAITKEHTVTALTLTAIDPDANTASGAAEPDSLVDAWTCDDVNCANRHLIATGGTWTAYFSEEGPGDDEKDLFDLIPGSWVHTSQSDDDGDLTSVSASVPNPRIEANLTWDWMATHEFTPEATATFEVYESFGGAMLPEFPQQVNTDELGDSWLEGREFGANLQPGMHIVATDDFSLESRSLILEDLTLDVFDPESDIVSGTTESAGPVWVDVGNESEGCGMEVLVVGGFWSADFSGGPCFLDVTSDMGSSARLVDDDGDETVAELSPIPHIQARPVEDAVEGRDWPEGAQVELVVIDPIDGELFNGTQTAVVPEWDPWSTWLRFDFEFDLRAGQTLTMSHGPTVKTHTITSLQVLGIDVVDDIVFGSAAPESWVDLWVCEDWDCVDRHVVAGLDESWNADFSAPHPTGTYDFVPGSWVDVSQWDEDGDATWIWFNVPDPRIQAWPLNDFVEGFDWPVDEYVDLVIDNDGNVGNGVKYSTSALVMPAEWDPSMAWVGFELPEGVELQPGDDVTLSHGTTVKVHIVRDFAVTSADLEADTVYGTAEPESVVQVNPHDYWEEGLYVTADESGNWSADFSSAVDIVLGTGFSVSQEDDDRDSTTLDWRVPNPRFFVFPESDEIFAIGWPDIDSILVEIDAASGPDYSAIYPVDYENGNFWIYLDGIFDIVPGHHVTLSHGVMSKDHIVTEITVTDVDAGFDTISGTANPGAEVLVVSFDYPVPPLRTYADDDGNWTIDYTGEFDLLPGMNGIAAEYDDDRDGTEVYWYIPGYGQVYGSVLLDGAPLADSEVFMGIFTDEIDRRFACTDANGNFEFVDVPYGPGLISITGPSGSDPGCENTFFLDSDGIPLLTQAWDHHDMVFYLTWFSLDVWTSEMTLQFDVHRAMATQTVIVEIDGPAPDLTPVRAFDTSQILFDPTPGNYADIFEGMEGRIANTATGPPFGAGVAELRYPRWLGTMPEEILILVQYTEPNPGLVTIGALISDDFFHDRGDGILVGHTLHFCDPGLCQVTIDIKPGDLPNPINLKSKGKLPVAVLTTEDFDATTVDPDKAEFAGASPTKWSWEDVDDDGDLDLMLHFETQELDLDENSTQATLTGTTFGGVYIEGSDAVNIVSK